MPRYVEPSVRPSPAFRYNHVQKREDQTFFPETGQRILLVITEQTFEEEENVMTNANFEYCVPTHIYFGDNQIQKLGAELAKHGSRVLLIYGSERLKTTPLYASILDQIKSAGLTLFEMGGVEPNPRHTTVDRAAGICRDKNIDVLLAVGGAAASRTARS